MKRLSSMICLVALGMMKQAQTILNSRYYDGTYLDPYYIKMTGGFHALPSNGTQTFTARIQQNTNPGPLVYVPFYDNTSLNNPIDISLAVGATAGESGVSNGAATYSIPIMTAPPPSSLKYMQVPVSLQYSSMANSGFLGQGWNISTGASTISRRQKTIAEDNMAMPISEPMDEFSLDGEILVFDATFASRGSKIERWLTKSESFSEILSYRDNADHIYRWKIQKKDGLVYYYGSSKENLPYDNLISANNPISSNPFANSYMIFYLHRIDNIYKNNTNMCIRFEYEFGNGMPRLKKIKDVIQDDVNNQRYSEVEFFYSNKSEVNQIFLAGTSLYMDKLLNNIVVRDFSQNEIRRYHIKYSRAGINTYLAEIHEQAPDGTKLNPTKFK